MEGATLNPLMLAAIGTPTLVGIYFRLKRWNVQAFRLNVIISCTIMAAIAIGYAFMTFGALNPFFSTYSHLIVATVAGVALAATMLHRIGSRGGQGLLIIPFALIGFWLAAYLCSIYVSASIVMPLAALILFCGLGLINAVLGPFAVGLSVSATLHACFASNGFDYVMLWQQLFDLLEVSQAWIKLMLIAGGCLAGSGDLITWMATRLLDDG